VNSFFAPDAATIECGAAKAAVVNLSKSLAQEFGPKVATLVTLLASDRTANVTGVNYVIDGGLIKTT
jgi:NAD(P)-dependent dehydrogenase (short-subunit alcohol dehydrogenase family)